MHRRRQLFLVRKFCDAVKEAEVLGAKAAGGAPEPNKMSWRRRLYAWASGIQAKDMLFMMSGTLFFVSAMKLARREGEFREFKRRADIRVDDLEARVQELEVVHRDLPRALEARAKDMAAAFRAQGARGVGAIVAATVARLQESAAEESRRIIYAKVVAQKPPTPGQGKPDASQAGKKQQRKGLY